MRNLIARILRLQAKRFLDKYDPKVVVVSGSVGKTSTTQAIITVLERKFNVIGTIANYNTDIGVPCSIFKRNLPEKLYNPFAWLLIFLKNEIGLLVPKKVEVLVLEIGTDKPGEISQFSWLKPDLAVVTAVAPEHMEYFKTINAVAQEELAVKNYSDKLIVNKKMIDKKYLKKVDNSKLIKYDRNTIKKFGLKADDLKVVGDHSVDAVAAALCVGRALGMKDETLQKVAKKVTPRPGRMNVLKGIKDSTLIDDTYNSSPEAVIAALDYLYNCKTKQRIALLGNMNELGDSSKAEHIKVGEYCDPKRLNFVVTLGPDANKFTAPAARAFGCNVAETKTPYEAAEVIIERMDEASTILLKGSQNGVFAEETTKLLLADPKDQDQLVRQSPFWLLKKQQNFKREN